MSECQYYEFRAIDAPLGKRQIATLRGLSSRATITPVSFVNEYHYGSLSADPLEWMKRCFDAFVYVANWCERELMFRLPKRLFDPKPWQPFTDDGALSFTRSKEFVVISIGNAGRETDAADGHDGSEWLDRLLPIRAEIASGDHRALYLAWLGGLTEDDSTGDGPTVPAGLRSLTPAQKALVRFLEVPARAVSAAARTSPPLRPVRRPDISRSITRLSKGEALAWVRRIAMDDPVRTKSALLRELEAGRRERSTRPDAVDRPGRTNRATRRVRDDR